MTPWLSLAIRGVVPVGDLAEVDAGQDRAGQVQLATPGMLKPTPVAESAHGILTQPCRPLPVRGHRGVGGAEVDECGCVVMS